MNISDFFTLPDGRTAKLYTLTGANGIQAEISDFGGVITSLYVPDRDGKLTDVVLGYKNPADYLVNGPHFGAMIGRVANRIAKGEFTLDGVKYSLTVNNGENTLHGGNGYHRRLWNVTGYTDNRLELELFSPDGDAGFPGNLTIKAVYTLTDDNSIEIEMNGVTDSVTVINLTNHSYFNLSGDNSGPITDHEIAVYADSVQEVNSSLIPTGKLLNVKNTPCDLRKFTSMETAFKALPGGYDNSFVKLDGMGSLRPIAAARSASSGIRMDVLTTDCAVQLYTAGMMSDQVIGKDGKPYQKLSAFCLESQHLVDSPNHPDFPSIRLEAGEEYYQKTCYKFSVEAF